MLSGHVTGLVKASDSANVSAPITPESVEHIAVSLVSEQKEKERRQLNIIVHKLAESSANNGPSRKNDDIKSHTVPSLNDVDISPSVVFNKLNVLQCCKSAGPDGWPPAALKETAAEISFPLSIIFSKSLQSGHLPDCWKIANVVPIHKSGSRHLTNNYRPISLTCIVGKVLESIVRDRIDYQWTYISATAWFFASPLSY